MSHKKLRYLVAAATLLPSVLLLSQTTPKLSFSAPQSIPGSSKAGATVILDTGDVNGDGNADILVQFPDALRLLSGNGNGGFTPTIATFGYFGEFDALYLANLDNSGKLGALAVHPGSIDDHNCESNNGQLTVFTGDGKGHFTVVSEYALQPGTYTEATTGDFNHDGKQDIAVLSVDTDGDCAVPIDIVYIFLNKGNGQFTQAQAITVQAYGPLETGDFNGDGKVDLAFAGYTIAGPGSNAYRQGNVQVLSGNGDGSFRTGPVYAFVDIPPNSQPGPLAAADLNGDGKTDLVIGLAAKNVSGAYPRIATLLAKQAGGFYWASAVSVPSAPYNLSLADFNGDGKLDLLTMLTSSLYNKVAPVLVSAGQGNGRFASTQSFATFPYAYQAYALPFKKGARPNIIFGNSTPQTAAQDLGLLVNETK